MRRERWVTSKLTQHKLYLNIDLPGRAVRCAVVAHLPRAARGVDRGRHRRHALRLHPAVHHVQVLGQPEHLPQVQPHLGQQLHPAQHVAYQGTSTFR